jgi:hypothetical protein
VKALAGKELAMLDRERMTPVSTFVGENQLAKLIANSRSFNLQP